MLKRIIKVSVICWIALLLSGCLSLFAFDREEDKPKAQVVVVKDEFEESLTLLSQKLQPLTYTGTGKPAVAIMLFSSDKKNEALESYVQEVLHEQFFKQGNAKLIDRANFDALMKEQNFQLSGYVDDATAKNIGYLIGVDFLCFGTIIDMGNMVRIAAKLADVQTGEIAAMSSVNVPKNSYVNSITGISGGASQGASPQTQKSQNLWQVSQTRNEFDGYTTYTFLLPCSGEEYLFAGYDKWDVPARSVVRTGIHWVGGSGGTYEMKGDAGQIVKKSFDYSYWSKISGRKDGQNQFSYSRNGNESARFMLELFLNNNVVTIRKNDIVRRFETAGLSGKMTEAGISWQEINAALRNEEF